MKETFICIVSVKNTKGEIFKRGYRLTGNYLDDMWRAEERAIADSGFAKAKIDSSWSIPESRITDITTEPTE